MFLLCIYSQPDEDLTTFSVLDCPAWPKWVLADSLTALQWVASVPDLDFYNPKDHLWLWADLVYPHEVSKDSYIFFQHWGIHCHDFQKHLDQVLVKLPHQHVNMRGERDSVKKGLKANKEKKWQQPNLTDHSKSDIEFTDVTPQQHTIKHHRSLSPLHDELPATNIYRLHPQSVPPSSCHHHFPSIPCHPLLPNLSLDPLPSPQLGRKFGTKGFMSLMLQRVSSCSMPITQLESGRASFQLLSTYHPHPSCQSFYDQHDQWMIVTQAQWDTTLAAGWTPPGLWSAFVCDVPLK